LILEAALDLMELRVVDRHWKLFVKFVNIVPMRKVGISEGIGKKEKLERSGWVLGMLLGGRKRRRKELGG
jgi:hypothetical protein